MSENNGGVTASDSAVDHAVEAGKRLRDAAGKAAGSTPMDWGKLVLGPMLTGKSGPGDHWGKNAAAGIGADELVEAGKQIGRAYIDANERAVLFTIELRERLAAAANADWVTSMAKTQAELERDAATACFSLARELLT